jgi:hypothetical protein
MNGHWDVTETKFLEGIRTGQEEVRLKISIPSNTQGYTCFERQA